MNDMGKCSSTGTLQTKGRESHKSRNETDVYSV